MDENNITGTVLNVLSLEDSVRDFEIIREQLIDAGYHLNISRVENEKEFESSIRGNQYDIILADFKLPGFDSFGALRLCNAICPDDLLSVSPVQSARKPQLNSSSRAQSIIF